ncbi:MAG: peptide ABC transporter substrate-binding protein [Alphaproteobacteria bacterium]|nr:peptide ABC transporter substrate-binding protein [Alphaproteobacteria bacterium]
MEGPARPSPVALDRFCRAILDEINRLGADANQTAHQRYRAIYQLINRRDKEMAEAFDNLRRSHALLMIAKLRQLGAVTDDEFTRFSAETRAAAEDLLRIMTGRQ